VITSDHVGSARPHGSQNSKLVGGIDFKSVRFDRDISRCVKCDHPSRAGGMHALYQTATFARKRGTRLALDLRPLCGIQK
jgi:hypothetical protein